MPSSERSLKPTPAATSGRDSWQGLSRYTDARIALGRAGGSYRTATLLELRLAHARARDAVQQAFDPQPVIAALRHAGHETFSLATLAASRPEYLLRPDLGRRLSETSRQLLEEAKPGWGPRQLAIIVSDGLSALAAQKQAVPTLLALLPLLRTAGWTWFPVFLAPFGRVKLQDEVGQLLGARHTLMLLGERPGLGSPDSLGAYFTFGPGPQRTDADRNCLSNIRPEGLPPAEAARKLAYLLGESARLGVSGVALKDTTQSVALPPAL